MAERFVRSVNSVPDYAPYQVGLVDAFYNSQICGGAIINSFFILTAAHCLVRSARGNESTSTKYYHHVSELHIVAGQYNLQWSEETEQIRAVDRMWVTSKQRLYTNLTEDIALIKLTHPFKFNSFIQPIKLAQSGREFSGNVSTFGWGAIKIHPEGNAEYPVTSRRSDMEIISNQECALAHKSIPNYMMCGFSNVSTICSGDSGSPVVCRDEDHKTTHLPAYLVRSRDILCGIVSWGSNNTDCIVGQDGKPLALPTKPSVFSKISYFSSWIAYNIRLRSNMPSYFLCNNLQFVHKLEVCDFYRDCEDGSDELNCQATTTQTTAKRSWVTRKVLFLHYQNTTTVDWLDYNNIKTTDTSIPE